MGLENIEKSELVIATILRILVERGIAASEMEFSSLGLPDSFFPFFATCFRWLQSEGIVRAEKVAAMSGDDSDDAVDLYIYNPTLTSRGFTLLGQSIKVGNTETTVAKAVETRASGQTTGWQIGDLVGGVLGGFTKSIGS
jgi:hypothetical protein